MVRRIAAIAFIYGCTAIAWSILGGTIMSRTYDSGASSGEKVHGLWGGPQVQKPATAEWDEVQTEEQMVQEGTTFKKQQVKRTIEHGLPLEQTRAKVNVHLDYRQKGLLWFSTYTTDFDGRFTFRNDTNDAEQVKFLLPYPSDRAVYENVAVKVNGTEVSPQTEAGAIAATATVPPGQSASFETAFRSHGMDDWAYSFGDQVTQLRDFELQMTTDFKKIDFPEESLVPTTKRETADGWQLTWQYQNLVSGFHIDLKMPQKLQPGPLVGRISFFAPVSLFFFFFLMMVIAAMRNIDLHPMNYFFLAAAFFAFHLLLAYLVDHISIHVAMAICSAVSVFLVVRYLRIVVGPKFAYREAALGQLVYLVLFSYAFFWEGFTALSVTIVAIITLAIVMQATAKVNWTEKFAGIQPAAPPYRIG